MSGKRSVDFCRACDAVGLFVGLDLGESPVANRLPTSNAQGVKSLPLIMRVCPECGLGQLEELELPENIFSDYPYLSSTSKSWLDANASFADSIIVSHRLKEGDLVVEVASNDGYLLSFFKEQGLSVLGIEPAENVAQIANDLGVETLVDFFGAELANRLKFNGTKPKLIVAKNVMAHVPNLQDFVEGLSILTGDDTLLVIEAPTILQILSEMQFDTIYHEHFSYLSVTSVGLTLRKFGLELMGVEKVSTHGGSLRFLAKKLGGTLSVQENQRKLMYEMLKQEKSAGLFSPDSWLRVGESIQVALADFTRWLSRSDSGIRTVGYGAAAKGVTFLAAAEVKPGQIDLVIDNSPEKAGKYFPLVMAPIVTEESYLDLEKNLPMRTRFIIFPWNLCDEILERILKFNPGAEVYRALPKLLKLN